MEAMTSRFVVAAAAVLTCAALPLAAVADTTLVVGKANPEAESIMTVNVGYDAGLFKKHGLDLQIQDFTGGGSRIVQALTANSSSLAPAGPPVGISSSNFSAAIPSVAVARNGTVGVLYDEFDGASFHVHLAVSRDLGASVALNTDLYTFNTNGMVFSYGLTNHNRLLGDYDRMIAVSNTLYATFPGRGNTVGNINTTNLIVPFFYAFDSTVAAPVVLGITRPTGGTVKLDFSGSPGATYYVQATTNLLSRADWQTVSTNVAPASGLWSYTDATTPFPQRYYRAFTP